MTEEEFSTVAQMAKKFRVSEETIRRWMRDGHVKYTPVGPFGLKRLKSSDLIKGVTSGQQSGNTGNSEK